MPNFDDMNIDEEKTEELSSGTEDSAEGKETHSEADDGADEEKKEYEDVCFICRRPESKAGKMFKLPNNICVCSDCMHKTMDTVSQFDYQGLLNNPSVFGGNQSDDNKGGRRFPNISIVNLADLQGEGGIPNKQKIKKKSEKKKSQPVLDIKNIPAPHKIKAQLDEYVIGQERAKKIISLKFFVCHV